MNEFHHVCISDMHIYGGCMGVSISCSTNVSNVMKIERSTSKKSIYYNALLGGTMVFISPLSNVNRSQC
jgi:hypothetical protein